MSKNCRMRDFIDRGNESIELVDKFITYKFGFSGKRRCLGETLARSSLFLFFTHVVHNFDITISEKHGPPCLDGSDGFVISPKPYHLVLTPRFVRQ